MGGVGTVGSYGIPAFSGSVGHSSGCDDSAIGRYGGKSILKLLSGIYEAKHEIETAPCFGRFPHGLRRLCVDKARPQFLRQQRSDTVI